MGGAHVIKYVLRTFGSVAIGTCARQVISSTVSAFMFGNNVVNRGITIAQLFIAISATPIPIFKNTFSKSFTRNFRTENN